VFEGVYWDWPDVIRNGVSVMPPTDKYLIVEASQGMLYNVFLCSWYPTKNGTVLQYDV
jgi:hypothetical protein